MTGRHRFLRQTVLAASALAVSLSLTLAPSAGGAPDPDGAHASGWRSLGKLSVQGQGPVASVDFADAAHGVAVLGTGLALTTSDGGVTWQTHRVSGAQRLYAARRFDGSHALVVGMATAGRHVVCTTSDGGTTWEPHFGSPQSGGLQVVSFPDSRHGWAVRLSFTEGAEDSLIVASNDGGRAWETQYRVRSDWRRGYAHLCGVDFPDSDHGWAVGNRYFDNTAIPAPAVVFSTADGGRKWRSSEFGVGMDLWAVDAIDATHVWAVGRSIAETEAAALVTTDGATWVKRKLGVKGLLYQVQFVDPLHGWAAGITPPTSTSGTPQQPVSFVLATTDGGTTWVRQRIEDNRQLRVEFVDALHGWAYDGDGRMWVTETGGFAPPPRSSAPSSSPAVSGCSSRRVVGGSPR